MLGGCPGAFTLSTMVDVLLFAVLALAVVAIDAIWVRIFHVNHLVTVLAGDLELG